MTTPNLNPYKGETPVEIGGQKLTLSYDWNALAEVQEVAGDMALQEIFTMKIKMLVTLLLIGLKKHHPEIEEKHLMDASPDIYSVQTAMSKAMELTYWGKDGPPQDPQPADGDDKKKPTPSETPSA